jgi:MFS family permease
MSWARDRPDALTKLLGYDGSVLNGLQAVDSWQSHFSNPNGALLGIITASFNIGAVSGIPLLPWTNDRFGRKACVVIGSILIAIGVVIQTVAINGSCKIS